MHWDAEEDSWGWLSSVPDFQTRGVASYEALARIMGIDPIPDVEEARQLAEYRRLIEQGAAQSDAATRLRRTLEQHFGPQHPEILECNRLIRLQALRQQARDKGKFGNA
jgi:predicted ATP-binding protein involved in virulence